MNIDEIVLYSIIGIIAVCLLIFAIIQIVKFCKMSKEEKIKTLKTYLKGLVSLAEQEITGSKMGAEKLAMVEEYFNKKAPIIYKIILALLGKDNLRELIESALKELKESFGG